MLYLSGGGLYSESATNPHSDCTNLASRGDSDVACLAINDRVANLGFLVVDDGAHRGNYGLISDMITALQWVQEKHRSFGGDPSRALIFGESRSWVRALLAFPQDHRPVFPAPSANLGPVYGCCVGQCLRYKSCAASSPNI